uniref:Uncharacterized protein n=1 Tax=Anguilla anguilla TaxID=7936 RepID=A0A0E9SS21_ANGAN
MDVLGFCFACACVFKGALNAAVN